MLLKDIITETWLQKHADCKDDINYYAFLLTNNKDHIQRVLFIHRKHRESKKGHACFLSEIESYDTYPKGKETAHLLGYVNYTYEIEFLLKLTKL